MKKLGKTISAMVLCTLFMIIAVFAATTQSVSTASNIAFTADKNVEATVEVLINGTSKGNVTFAANKETNNKTLVIGNLVNANWVDPDILGSAYIEKRITVEIKITNNSDKSNLGVVITPTGTVDINCNLTTAVGDASVAKDGAVTTYTYVFDVIDINENVTAFDYDWSVALTQSQE